MAITTNTYNIVELPMQGKLFHISLTSADLSGAETALAAVAKKTHYITHIQFQIASACDLEIGSGESVAGTIDTVHIGTIALDANNGNFVWNAPEGKGLKCTSGTLIAIKASAGNAWCEMRGKTCSDKI